MLYDMSRLSNDPGRPAGADGRRQPQKPGWDATKRGTRLHEGESHYG